MANDELVGPYEKLVNLAHLFVGLREDSPNDGPLIRMFQETVDGRAEKEAWCCGFAQYLIKQVDNEIFTENPAWHFSKLAKTESCVKLWEMSPLACRRPEPKSGYLVVWRHWALYRKENRWVPTSLGHVGVVTPVIKDGTMDVIEGNTGAGSLITRNGDGVWIKTRSQKVDTGPMRIEGFLDPWGI